MRTAYSYIRMSTDTQLKGDSLRRQLEASETYAKNNQLKLVDSIDGVSLKDLGVSGFRGKNTKKGVLSIFLEALELGKIKPNSVLLIESLDRLSRDRLSEALAQFMSILNQGIEIITLTDNQKYTKAIIDQNPSAIFISLGIMFRANEESEIKSKRLSSAWSNKRTNINSKILTKTCPAWLRYSEATGKFEIIEGRDKVVKTIFDMCINTGGLFSIARYLNENKVPVFGKGKLWYISYIKKIIINRSVIGEFQPHMMIDGKRQKTGDAIANYFPKIIDEQTYLLARASVARRTLSGKGRKGTNFTNLFAGLTYCGSCGTKMMLRSRGGSHRSSRHLACSNKLVNGGCQMMEWNLADFESIVFRHLREINFDELIDTNSEEKIITLEDQGLALNEKQKSKEQEINRAMDLIVGSELSPEVKQRLQLKLNELELEIKTIKQEIDDISKLIAAKNEYQKVFTSSSLKKILDELKSNENDYLFRSTVNQFLIRAIGKIELLDTAGTFEPWQYDEADPEILAFRASSENNSTRNLYELLESGDFEKFIRRYYREIKITYKSGATRKILYGTGMSFGAGGVGNIKTKLQDNVDANLQETPAS